jgi:hypothetical protein
MEEQATELLLAFCWAGWLAASSSERLWIYQILSTLREQAALTWPVLISQLLSALKLSAPAICACYLSSRLKATLLIALFTPLLLLHCFRYLFDVVLAQSQSPLIVAG